MSLVNRSKIQAAGLYNEAGGVFFSQTGFVDPPLHQLTGVYRFAPIAMGPDSVICARANGQNVAHVTVQNGTSFVTVRVFDALEAPVDAASVYITVFNTEVVS